MWITSLRRLNKTINRFDQILLIMFQRLASATLSSLATAWKRVVALQFPNSIANCTIRQPGRQSNRSHSTVSNCHRFARSPASATSLVEIPDERVEFTFQSFDNMCIRHPNSIAETT